MPIIDNMTVRSSALAFDRLQPQMTLVDGNLYAIANTDSSLGDLLLWHTITAAIKAGRAVTLVSATDPVPGMRNCGVEIQAQSAQRQGALACLQLADPTPQQDAVNRVETVLRELQYFHASRACLVIVDGAEQLFAGIDAQGLRTLRSRAESEGNAILLLYRASGSAGNGFVDILQHASLFAGLGRLGSRFGASSWDVFHWFGPTGLTVEKTFPVQRAGQRLAVPERAPQPVIRDVAADESRVLAQRSAFLGGDDAPAGWRVVEGDLDDLAGVASDAVGATVVLSFAPGTDFEHLARTVFALRARCGARLKIVIREVNTSTRHSQEALLLRLGANLVVPAEVAYARFLGLCAAVQGQVFPHCLPASPEQALSEGLTDERSGYLPVPEFCATVLDTLARSRMLQVENVLLRMPLTHGLVPLDALRHCQLKRNGDLCTADKDSVYLFLYACREGDVERTLARVFRLPVAELFSTEDRYFTPHSISGTLAALEARTRQQRIPDLSAELTQSAEAGSRVGTASTAAPERTGLPVERFLAPVPATRRPLRLRGAPALAEVAASTYEHG